LVLEGKDYMTESTKAILRYYLRLERQRFRLSLDSIATATGVSAKTVQRANTCLRDAGVISWIQGHGDMRAGGTTCTPNEYRLDPAAVRRWRRIKKQRAMAEVEAETGTGAVLVSVSACGQQQ